MKPTVAARPPALPGRHPAPAAAVRLLAFAAVALLLSCGGPPSDPRPDPEPSGRLIITSPVHQSRVSGAVFFAVQLADPADLGSLELRVDGEVVRHQFPGETPLRVFLIPRDHPEGPLQLSASVGSGANRETTTVTVQVVHAPPSAASVGATGAVLGGLEANGAISTVSIPAGTARGATVSFETMTQAEVLTATGVDYDALGVTFLGAQEIRSTIPTGDGVAMTSGGFGPMVQPGQAVVSYRIGPDMGRGMGELMVINTAAVAPNGDVVSSPPVVPRAGEATASSLLGSRALAPAGGGPRPASTLPGGPPGSFVEVAVSGLNIYAVHGYHLRFRVGSTTAEAPATVGLGGDGRQYLFAVVPPLPTGSATVELVWKVGDTVIADYAMGITAPQPIGGSAKAIVDANYQGLLDAVDQADSGFQAQGVVLDFGPIRSLIAQARADYAARADDDAELLALARSLWNGGLRPASAGARPSQTSAACMLNNLKYINDKQFAERAFRGDRYEAGFRGLQADLTIGYLNRFADRLGDFEAYDCDPYKEFLCQELGNCDSDEEAQDPWGDQGPDGPAPRAPGSSPGNGPNDWITGMGSALLPGGPAAGTFRDDAPDGGDGLRTSSLAGAQSIQRGRYGVTAVYAGQPMPFASLVQEDGYFYIPVVPEGQGSQLVFTDLQTWRECVLPINGARFGSMVALYVDFASCAGDPVDPGTFSIQWVGGASQHWHIAQNWDPPRLPNADDDVWIPGSASHVRLPYTISEYQPPTVVQLRSLRSQGTVALANTILQTSGDVEVAVYRLDWPGPAEVQAGGTFSYQSLYVAYGTPGFTLADEPVTLRAVHLDGGTLTVPHSLTVEETLTMTNFGRLDGPGTTVVPPGVWAGVIPSLSSVGYVGQDHTLQIFGTFDLATVRAAGSSASLGGGTVHIMPGAELLMTGNSALGSSSPGGGGLILNQGRLVIAGSGSQTLLMSTSLQNDGVIEVAAGSRLMVQTGSTGVFRLGADGELMGQGSTEVNAFSSAELQGGTIGGGHRFINQAGQFGGTTWVAGAGPVTVEAGAEIVNRPNPENDSLSTFMVDNDQPMLGGGTFRNAALLRKTASGGSTWSLCYLEEGAGSFVADPGTIAFTGSCPP